MDKLVYGDLFNESAALLVNVKKKNIQDIDAEVLSVYWQESEFPYINSGDHIHFVCLGGTWGRVELEVGERAVVFVSRSGTQGRLYEHSQHIRIEEIEGRWWAADFFDITQAKGVPSWLLDAAQPYQQGTVYFRVPFELMERHLRDIAKLAAS